MKTAYLYFLLAIGAVLAVTGFTTEDWIAIGVMGAITCVLALFEIWMAGEEEEEFH